MGFRTVVILYNDQASEWEKDPALGEKIMRASHGLRGSHESEMRYGRVVESCHADQQTLTVIDSYSSFPIAHSHWRRDESNDDRNLRMLKEAAEKLGYNLSKKRVKA